MMGSPQLLARVLAVNVGQKTRRRRDHDGRLYWTAIQKAPLSGPVEVTRMGLAGDEQVDRKNHGGLDKAVHAHFVDHLAWMEHLSGQSVTPGRIGENLTLSGIEGNSVTEGDFCLGDIVQIGSVRLQVTQPRNPCYKQAEELKVKDLVSRVLATGRTGILFRVLQEGVVQAGDVVELLHRPAPQWPVARVTQLIRQPRRYRQEWAELTTVAGVSDSLYRLAVEWVDKLRQDGSGLRE